jgi:hypothetical protein
VELLMATRKSWKPSKAPIPGAAREPMPRRAPGGPPASKMPKKVGYRAKQAQTFKGFKD